MLLAMWIAAMAALAVSSPSPQTTERIYAKTEKSVYTIEVHTGNQDTKSTLGSGYLVSKDGRIITNYHVVGSFIKYPEQYQIRIKQKSKYFPAKLVNFDIVNDLALLQADGVKGRPIKLARKTGPKIGGSIVSLGNPHGLRLSIIDGIFNGFAEKGLIDRMLLSMPLNSGMSGGPILNRRGELIGTNVSIIWLSNNVSFGVPVDRTVEMMKAESLPKSATRYREEIYRQLLNIEANTVQKLEAGFAKSKKEKPIAVGEALLDHPPSIFNCWDRSKVYREKGIKHSSYSCDLQFSPSVEDTGEVASVELYLAHFSTTKSSYGFYGFLTQYGDQHHSIKSKDLQNAMRTAPECSVKRVTIGNLKWKLNTCVNAHVDYKDLYDFSLAGTSITHPKNAIQVSLHLKAFRLDSFTRLSRRILKGIRFKERS